MKFLVVGANKEKGEDVTIELDAPTPSAAEEMAHRLNLLIERIDSVNPTAPPTPHPSPQPRPAVQTIEKTSKKWKLMMLAGAGLVLIGIPAFFSTQNTFSGLIVFAGLILYIYARLAAWWHHG